MKIAVNYSARLYGRVNVEVPDGLTGHDLDVAVTNAAYAQIDEDMFGIDDVGISNYWTEDEHVEFEEE